MVCKILGDGKLEHIIQTMEDKVVNVNICAADKHVPETDRFI